MIPDVIRVIYDDILVRKCVYRIVSLSPQDKRILLDCYNTRPFRLEVRRILYDPKIDALSTK
jgi:hypothetical protein